MSTKEIGFFTKQLSSDCESSNSQFTNFNLNKCSSDISTCLPVQTFSKSNNVKNFGDNKFNDYREKSNLFKKSSIKSLKNLNPFDETEKEKSLKRNDNCDCSNKKSSTLSLHIAAYENSVDLGWIPTEQLRPNDLRKRKLDIEWQKFQDTFEFPRQQTDVVAEPAIMQFEASQILLNPNEAVPRKKYKKTLKKEIMINNRMPYTSNKSKTVEDAVVTTNNLPSTLSDESENGKASPKKFFISKEKQRLMQASITHKRELEQIKKQSRASQMKNLRNLRTIKALEQKVLAERLETELLSSPQAKLFDPFDPDDDYLECVVNSDSELQDDVKQCQIPSVLHASPPPSSKNSVLKNPKDLSSSGYYKRKKSAEQQICELLGPGHKIVSDNESRKVSIEKAAEYYVLHGCKDEQYAGLDRRFYPCLSLVKRYLKKLKEDLKDMAKDGLASAILNDLNSLDKFSFDNVRLNFGLDKGKDTVKIVWYYVDLKDPQSTKKLRVYQCLLGNEDRENILPHLILIDEAIGYLQSKIFDTKLGQKTFTCFYIADCKAGDETIGLQGGSSTCPCLYCSIPSKDWKNYESIPESFLRTIEELETSGKIIEDAIAEGSKTDAQLRQLKIQLKSVKATPMLKNIPINRFVPPVVHIGISAVSSVVKYCRKNTKGPELLAAIENMGVKTHQGTSDFTGPNCRKILKYFADHQEIQGFGIDLLRAYAHVEKFAEARDLSEAEMDAMDDAIKQYFSLMDSKYPDFAKKKVKLHVLRHHVMPFVREFKSWGKFSEQALEGIHKVKNQSDLRIKSGDAAAKIEYFMSMQMLVNHFYKKKAVK